MKALLQCIYNASRVLSIPAGYQVIHMILIELIYLSFGTCNIITYKSLAVVYRFDITTLTVNVIMIRTFT